MKYIDTEKLKTEIKRRRLSNRYIDTEGYENELLEIITSLQQEPRFPQYDNIVEKVFGAGNLEGWERDEAEMLVALAKEELLKSLQQEQPEVELGKELDQWRHKHFKGKRDGNYNGEYLERESQLDLARHFYELGQRTKYQQDRAEFAKLKAKEWQSGYDEGYAKGLNARKEK